MQNDNMTLHYNANSPCYSCCKIPPQGWITTLLSSPRVCWSHLCPWQNARPGGCENVSRISPGKGHHFTKKTCSQWLFLVSFKRWDRWHIPSPNWQEKCHLYIAFWGVICYLPPFRGTRNNHWCSSSAIFRCYVLLVSGNVYTFQASGTSTNTWFEVISDLFFFSGRL